MHKLDKLYVYTCLGCALTTSLPVQIDKSTETCTIPECSSISFYCNASDEEIEWLNPNNSVINSTRSSRIYSKILNHSNPLYYVLLPYIIYFTYSNSSDWSHKN